MKFIALHKQQKRRITWLLVATFLFQGMLPLLGHGSLAIASNLAADAQTNDAFLRAFCGMPFAKNPGLAGDGLVQTGGQTGEQANSSQSSGMGFCPACVLYDLSHVSLPGVPALGQIGQFERDTQASVSQIHFISIERFSYTAIRAPPLA